MYSSSYTGFCLQQVQLQPASQCTVQVTQGPAYNEFGYNEHSALTNNVFYLFPLRKGNAFTSMCQEFCPRWVEVYNPPGRHPLWVDTPGQTPLLWADPQWANSPHGQTPPTQQTATAADATDPTGMHSFCGIKLIK